MTIAREGGIAAVLNSMRRFPDDRVVHERALGCLSNLTANTGMSCNAHHALKCTMTFIVCVLYDECIASHGPHLMICRE